jgi:hypothetical protein
MRCGSFDGTANHRADLPDQAMLCDRCARLIRRARKLEAMLGQPVEVEARESHVEVEGRTYRLDETAMGLPLVKDDGPTNPFWAGPGPMPEAFRAAGWIDPMEETDDE